ncbi:hypothetical protein HHI36_004390 [Cryptolaemus montrouzieri]|uniref:Uncharacterized protein n=1 Tax=Cryptolaemus montrouzieri TaxID=559131 RepID=A0ABD2NRV3_9CUCU
MSAALKRRPDPTYKPGDKVLVTSHLLSKKKQHITAKILPKRDGPYTIPDDPEILLGTYHTSALKPYRGDAEDTQPVYLLRKRGRP